MLSGVSGCRPGVTHDMIGHRTGSRVASWRYRQRFAANCGCSQAEEGMAQPGNSAESPTNRCSRQGRPTLDTARQPASISSAAPAPAGVLGNHRREDCAGHCNPSCSEADLPAANRCVAVSVGSCQPALAVSRVGGILEALLAYDLDSRVDYRQEDVGDQRADYCEGAQHEDDEARGVGSCSWTGPEEDGAEGRQAEDDRDNDAAADQ